MNAIIMINCVDSFSVIQNHDIPLDSILCAILYSAIKDRLIVFSDSPCLGTVQCVATFKIHLYSIRKGSHSLVAKA